MLKKYLLELIIETLDSYLELLSLDVEYTVKVKDDLTVNICVGGSIISENFDVSVNDTETKIKYNAVNVINDLLEIK